MTTTHERRPGGGTLQETERIQAPMGGPGRGPMGGGMVGQKATTFGPSARRLAGRLAPQRTKALTVAALSMISRDFELM